MYTKDTVLHCKRAMIGWEIEERPNIIGKIPVILFEQEKEYAGVEPMINRREYMTSRTADVNGRFSDPALVANAEVINNLPEKGEDSKYFKIKNPGSTNPLYCLTWDSAAESKKVEADDLEYQILSKSFTPKIDLETLKGLNSISGRALRQVMLLAFIKADKRKETHDGYAKRIGNLIKAIIGNVLDISLKDECEKMRLKHEFQEPFAEDITALLDDLMKSHNSGGMSLKTYVEKNPYIQDPEEELKRLEEEAVKKQEEYKERMKVNVFETAE
ncbi:MAG: phage portal protein [Tannerellaceae bacterium]|nr:phage portal protein [Tannerellaceae bacterium]